MSGHLFSYNDKPGTNYGTWCEVLMSNGDSVRLASCPKCGELTILMQDFRGGGGIYPSVVCPNNACDFDELCTWTGPLAVEDSE